MDQVKVAIVGMGTVGTGVARLLVEHGERAARHSGKQLVLESVVVRDEEKPRDLHLPPGVLSTDLRNITHNPEIKVVAHLVVAWSPPAKSCSNYSPTAKMSSPPTKLCSPSTAPSCSIAPAHSICASRSKRRSPAAFRSSPTSASASRPTKFNRSAAS